MKSLGVLGVAGCATLALCACQGKTSAVASHGVFGNAYPASNATETGYGGAENRVGDPRDLPAPLIDGKPIWAANRTHTAEENAEYQFGRNGRDFGAMSETEYVSKAHAFIERPPKDLETLDRPNGDKLEYDAKGNTFLVVARNGAPRTMFKPRDGAAYWAQQKDREAKRNRTAQGSSSDQG